MLLFYPPPVDFIQRTAYIRRLLILGDVAKSRKVTVNFVMSVCPHGSTPLPIDGFP